MVFLAVDTVNVEVFPAVGLGLNEADARWGTPDTLNDTLPVKFVREMLTVYVAEPRAEIVWLGGDAVIVKFDGGGCDWTTSVTCVLCVVAPSDPVIVRVYVPGAVAAVVVTFSVDDAVGELVAGMKEPLAPDGKPLTLHVTVPL